MMIYTKMKENLKRGEIQKRKIVETETFDVDASIKT